MPRDEDGLAEKVTTGVSIGIIGYFVVPVVLGVPFAFLTGGLDRIGVPPLLGLVLLIVVVTRGLLWTTQRDGPLLSSGSDDARHDGEDRGE